MFRVNFFKEHVHIAYLDIVALGITPGLFVENDNKNPHALYNILYFCHYFRLEL